MERSGREAVVNNVAAVLSDISGRLGRDGGAWYEGDVAFDQIGFRSDFREAVPPDKQVRHFTAHVLLGYYWGTGSTARSYVGYRERGFSGPDYASGVAGLNFGVGLRSGSISASNAFDRVQDTLR